MECYFCKEEAAGQCRVCWRFYCPSHGNVLCQSCSAADRTAHQPHEKMAFMVVGRNEPHPTEPPKPVGGGHLQRVIAIGQTAKRDGAALDLLSLELYDDSFVVHLRAHRGLSSSSDFDPFAPGYRPEITIVASDDLGNGYRSGASGASGHLGYYRSWQQFYPALPLQARALRLVIPVVRWFPFGVRNVPSFTAGPWEFLVDL